MMHEKFIHIINRWLKCLGYSPLIKYQSDHILSLLAYTAGRYDSAGTLTVDNLDLGSELAFISAITTCDMLPHLATPTVERINEERNRVFKELQNEL